MREFTYIVQKDEEGSGVRRLLRRHFDFSSRLLAKLKSQKLVLLNEEPFEGWMTLKEGDVIRVLLPQEESHFPEEDIPIRPVYEDRDLLIIDKPAGYTVHPTKGHSDHTIANGLMKYMREHDERFKIRFVNRLDMDTSGLLIVGKNSHAQDDLTRQMHGSGLIKMYTAIVRGLIPEDRFTIDLPIGKPQEDAVERAVIPNGKPSVTHVRVLERFPEGYTLVSLLLKTGRTHQIRVHLSHLGYPVLGDPLYGGESELIDRQALHASRLEFFHPVYKTRIVASAPLPEDMLRILRQLRK